MTQENKQLLLRDLCARLPYGVKCTHAGYAVQTLVSIDTTMTFGVYLSYDDEYMPKSYPVEEIKPYLRPMSDMTEEEKKEYKSYQYHFSANSLPDYEGDFVFVDEVHELIDWLNAHHFDYRGLIEKGLAIKVTEENNPYE